MIKVDLFDLIGLGILAIIILGFCISIVSQVLFNATKRWRGKQ